MGRTDTATRVIPAPAPEVFAALLEPGALLAWLPPAGMTARFEAYDARPGGSYRMVLTYDDPTAGRGKTSPGSDVVDARFVEIVPDRRVVQAVDFESDDPDLAGTMLLTWSVRPVDGGTLVEVRADDVPPGISAADHAAGLASSLDNLARYLAGG